MTKPFFGHVIGDKIKKICTELHKTNKLNIQLGYFFWKYKNIQKKNIKKPQYFLHWQHNLILVINMGQKKTKKTKHPDFTLLYLPHSLPKS
jgi:hypothetical protein